MLIRAGRLTHKKRASRGSEIEDKRATLIAAIGRQKDYVMKTSRGEESDVARPWAEQRADDHIWQSPIIYGTTAVQLPEVDIPVYEGENGSRKITDLIPLYDEVIGMVEAGVLDDELRRVSAKKAAKKLAKAA